jgi:hypothetical protein
MEKAAIVGSVILKFAVGISLVAVFFAVIPITISLPTSLVDFLTSGPIIKIFQSIEYFLPIKFLVECFIFILILQNSSILFRAIVWIYDKIKDLG